jgi:3'-phosphoadenosine 5'-phosphosulfate sulfotransferase (PAPS reductase)/FAD synthetase
MFSSGAGSWAAARRVADEHGTDGLYLVFSDVSMEDEDNYRFLHEAAADIGGELVILKDGRDIWQVFKDNRFLGNTRLANCSKFLKQQPAREWLDANCDPTTTTVYVGIDWSEEHRMPAVRKNYLPYRAAAPLCLPPYVSKDDILAALRARGIDPPRLYDLGFSHANCGGGCVRAGQGQFAHLLQVMPERYAEWERNEQELREYLDKDVAILRDRRGGKTVPMTLRSFRERHESMPEKTDMGDIGGCGCFVDGDS